MKKSLPPLGDLEHELLAILWAQGEMTALAVRKHVARKLKECSGGSEKFATGQEHTRFDVQPALRCTVEVGESLGLIIAAVRASLCGGGSCGRNQARIAADAGRA